MPEKALQPDTSGVVIKTEKIDDSEDVKDNKEETTSKNDSNFDETSDEFAMEFEISDNMLPNLYEIDGIPNRYVLLNELLNTLNITNEQLVVKAKTVETLNLGFNEYKRKAHCLTFGVNKSSPEDNHGAIDLKVTLVKYTEKIKELLNVQTFCTS